MEITIPNQFDHIFLYDFIQVQKAGEDGYELVAIVTTTNGEEKYYMKKRL